MKQSQCCPKCRSRRFLITDPFEVPDQDSSNSVEPFPPFTHARGAWARASFGQFETWTCAGCGFTEWYAKNFESLDVSQSGGRVRYLDAGAPQGPGYR